MTDMLKQVTLAGKYKAEARLADLAAKEMAKHCDKRIAKYEKLCSLLVVALQVYANPETYHAVAFMFDRPCGDFVEDFSFSKEYDRAMPGKVARKALRDAEKLIGDNPELFGEASTLTSQDRGAI